MITEIQNDGVKRYRYVAIFPKMDFEAKLSFLIEIFACYKPGYEELKKRRYVNARKV